MYFFRPPSHLRIINNINNSNTHLSIEKCKDHFIFLLYHYKKFLKKTENSQLLSKSLRSAIHHNLKYRLVINQLFVLNKYVQLQKSRVLFDLLKKFQNKINFNILTNESILKTFHFIKKDQDPFSKQKVTLNVYKDFLDKK